LTTISAQIHNSINPTLDTIDYAKYSNPIF